VTSRTSRLYHLPGKRFAVGRRKELPRAVATAATLLGAFPPVMNLATRTGAAHHHLERLWARAVVRFLGIDLRISGLDRVDRSRSFVIAPLHEGFADIAALLHLPLDLRFVARDELEDWRLLGGYLRNSNQVIVDPESPTAAYRRLLRAAPRVFASGDSLVVFPQGTILGIESAFSAGAFRLAERSEQPLLPVVLTGSHRVWGHPFSPLVRFGQRIHMEILDPIEPAEVGRALPALQDEMKRLALAADPPPRRFVPERDGWWDDYRYEIDPAFAKLARRVARHRATKGSYSRSSGNSS
jgi:1-acyl-sn-glycerol-3-phosphate acyltransferase